MINKTTYTNRLEPEDRVWEAEQVEYRGYDPVVSAVRGRRREGFRSRSVADPYTLKRLDIYTAHSSDMTPVRTIPEWCDAVRPYSANICSAIKSESRFISDHEPDMDARAALVTPAGQGKAAGIPPRLAGYPDRSPVHYTRCMRCPLNNRRNYNLVIQSMFRTVNNFINNAVPVSGAAGGGMRLRDFWPAHNYMPYGAWSGSGLSAWRLQRLCKNTEGR